MNNNYKPSVWLERFIWLAPWWTIGLILVGGLPGFLWWLFTGSEAARRLLETGFFLSFGALMLVWGTAIMLIPFWGSWKGPTKAERIGFSSLVGLLWGMGIFYAARLFSNASFLLAARLGTAVVIVATGIGLAIQQFLKKTRMPPEEIL